MLQEQREVITWDPDGGIIIHDRAKLEATLSVYFRRRPARSSGRGSRRRRGGAAWIVGGRGPRRRRGVPRG